LYLRPIDGAEVQPQTEPTPRANIRGKVEAPRLARCAINVFAERSLAAYRDNAIAVVIVQKVGEHSGANSKVGVISAHAPFGFRQGEADPRQFRQSGVFAFAFLSHVRSTPCRPGC
jgi:hypothetical protein